MLVQKALQGFMTETRDLMEEPKESSVSSKLVTFYKGITGKIELVARPVEY